MTHRPNAITRTQECSLGWYIIICGLFTTPNLCPPDTKSWRRHCRVVFVYNGPKGMELAPNPFEHRSTEEVVQFDWFVCLSV